ncbi:MAG: hypothetical protein QM796_09140 [Chthoniobacteraceae bacterium]
MHEMLAGLPWRVRFPFSQKSMKYFPLFLLLLSGDFGLATNPSLEPTGPQQAAFLAQVESAFKAKDAAAIEKLYCLDGTAPRVRNNLEKYAIPEMLKGEYSNAEFAPVEATAAKGYTLKGVAYVPNLPPVIELVIHFKPSSSLSFKTSGPSSITMILGLKDGALFNVTAVPAAAAGSPPSQAVH